MVLVTFLFRKITFTLCALSLFVISACGNDATQQKQSTPIAKNASKPSSKSERKITKADQSTEIKPIQKEKTILFVPPTITDESEESLFDLRNESVLDLSSSDKQYGTDNWGSSDAPPPPRSKTEEPVLIYVDLEASFPGGHAAMIEYIRKNMRYPQDAKEKEIQGKCIVKLLIKADGSIGNVTVTRGVFPSIDKEAIRLIESMPHWIPAQINGKNVNSYFNLPIKFALD